MRRSSVHMLYIVAGIAAIGAAVSHPIMAFDTEGPRFRLEGSWIGHVVSDSLFYVTYASSSPANNRVAFTSDIFNFDMTFGGVFQDATAPQDSLVRGESVRTGPATFDFLALGYGRNEVDEIIYIFVERGSLEFLDAETYQLAAGEFEVFSTVEQTGAFGPLHDQDVDGDGLPDPGQVPILSGPTLPATARRCASVLGL